jgi:hypothetical protein
VCQQTSPEHTIAADALLADIANSAAPAAAAVSAFPASFMQVLLTPTLPDQQIEPDIIVPDAPGKICNFELQPGTVRAARR